MIVTVSLWVDQLLNSVIGDLASFQKLYKVTSFIILAVSCNNILSSISLTCLPVALGAMVDDRKLCTEFFQAKFIKNIYRDGLQSGVN